MIAETNTVKTHHQIDSIVENLHRNIDTLESVTIHYEPDHPPYQTTVELLGSDKQSSSNRFGESPWLHITRTRSDGDIISDALIPNPSRDAPKGKAFHLAAWLISQHTDTVIMGPADLDENIIALFKTLGITFQQMEK